MMLRHEYLFQLFENINGLLLPGGSAPLVGPGGYAQVGQIFFDLAINVRQNKANLQNKTFSLRLP